MVEWETCPTREEETPQWCWDAIRWWSEYDKGRYFYPELPMDDQPAWFFAVASIVGAVKAAKERPKE